MISVEEARNIVKANAHDLGAEKIHISRAIGRVLAREVRADRDFPPFDRVTMDGVAFSFEEYQKGTREFEIESISLAGEPPKRLANPENAIEIMTGAVMAAGCTAMVRYEDLELFERERKRYVKVLDEGVFEWKNIHKQGSDCPAETLLISKGTLIQSALISILATVGVEQVEVMKLPRVAVISTGDELVDVSETPEPYQIRKSNTLTIQAELNRLGIENELFHLLDQKESIKKSLETILHDFDVVILSGGVSKGKVDHIPDVLEELGVEKLFHRVAQRPGKPFWFGVYQDHKPIFAFPGNPISTFACFKVYFTDWLNMILSQSSSSQMAVLTDDFSFKPDLGYFLQVKGEGTTDAQLKVTPQAGNGSGDIANLAMGDGFVFLPAGKTVYRKGEVYEYFPF